MKRRRRRIRDRTYWHPSPISRLNRATVEWFAAFTDFLRPTSQSRIKIAEALVDKAITQSLIERRTKDEPDGVE